MIRILVTGGLGFLGSHLVEELRREHGREALIDVVDDRSSNAVDDAEDADLIFYEPLREFLDAEAARHRYDVAYHLASVVGPVGVLPRAGRIVGDVVADSYAIAHAVRAWGGRLVDVSTSEVYGGGDGGFCSETMPRIVEPRATPRLEYAVAKLAAETALLNLEGIDVVIVRPFNIAGPRQRPDGGFVLPRFARQALLGEPLTVYGDGQQVRAFTHVADTARGIRLAGERGRKRHAYNVGNARNRTTILSLAHLVVEIARSRSSIEFVDPRSIWGPRFAEAADKWPDARLAERELGWNPTRSIDEVVEGALATAREAIEGEGELHRGGPVGDHGARVGEIRP